jgi:hypothetical protein
MKKLLLVFVCLMLPVAAFGQEKTEKALYDISLDALTTIEAYCACAENTAGCTQDDARALKYEVETILRDIMRLAKSFHFAAFRLTMPQARVLGSRVNAVSARLANIPQDDIKCNRAKASLEDMLEHIKIMFWIIVILLTGYPISTVINPLVYIFLAVPLLICSGIVILFQFLGVICLFIAMLVSCLF